MPPNRDYPAMKWDPLTGENRVFQSAGDVPEGWIDTHPNNLPAAAAAAAAESKPDEILMTREDIIAALTTGGITFKAKAKTDVLYALLVGSLEAHLKDANIPFPENATGPELLALVPKPE